MKAVQKRRQQWRASKGQYQPRQAALQLDGQQHARQCAHAAYALPQAGAKALLQPHLHSLHDGQGNGASEADYEHSQGGAGLGARQFALHVENGMPRDLSIGSGKQPEQARGDGAEHEEAAGNDALQVSAVIAAMGLGHRAEHAVGNAEVCECQHGDERADGHPHAEALNAQVVQGQRYGDECGADGQNLCQR